MICIGKITDEDFEEEIKVMKEPRIRYGARGLVYNSEGKIAVLYKKIKNEYKLIGGGIDENEDPIKAFKREVLEETGCIVDIDDCLGTIVEQKSHDNFIQTSYVYVSHVIEDTGKDSFTEQEKGEKSVCLWLKLEEAIDKIKNCENSLIASKYDGEMSVYHTKFIVRRDYKILEYYKNHR